MSANSTLTGSSVPMGRGPFWERARRPSPPRRDALVPRALRSASSRSWLSRTRRRTVTSPDTRVWQARRNSALKPSRSAMARSFGVRSRHARRTGHHDDSARRADRVPSTGVRRRGCPDAARRARWPRTTRTRPGADRGVCRRWALTPRSARRRSTLPGRAARRHPIGAGPGASLVSAWARRTIDADRAHASQRSAWRMASRPSLARQPTMTSDAPASATWRRDGLSGSSHSGSKRASTLAESCPRPCLRRGPLGDSDQRSRVLVPRVDVEAVGVVPGQLGHPRAVGADDDRGERLWNRDPLDVDERRPPPVEAVVAGPQRPQEGDGLGHACAPKIGRLLREPEHRHLRCERRSTAGSRTQAQLQPAPRRAIGSWLPPSRCAPRAVW